MNTRCYRCGWSLSLSRENIAAALANANATGTKHHIERCPRCRQTIKIPIDQLKRFAPHDAATLELQPQPTPVDSPPTPIPSPMAEATKAAEASPPPPLSPKMEAASPVLEKPHGEQAKSAAKPSAEKTSEPKRKPSAATKSNKPAAKKPAAKKKTSSR